MWESGCGSYSSGQKFTYGYHDPPRLRTVINWKLLEYKHHCPQWNDFNIAMDWEGDDQERNLKLEAVHVDNLDAFWEDVLWSVLSNWPQKQGVRLD